MIIQGKKSEKGVYYINFSLISPEYKFQIYPNIFLPSLHNIFPLIIFFLMLLSWIHLPTDKMVWCLPDLVQ